MHNQRLIGTALPRLPLGATWALEEMTRKGQKLRELWTLERFLKAMGGAAPAESSAFIPSEGPDWVLSRKPGPALGIEITTLHHQHSRHSGLTLRQEEGIQTHVCQLIERRWNDKSGWRGEVSVYFTGDQFPTKGKQRRIVDAVIALLDETAPPDDDRYTQITPDVLWDHPVLGGIIHMIATYRNSTFDRLYVHAPGAAFLPSLETAHLKTAILAKSAKVEAYRRVCGEIWLVLVHNDASISTHFDPRSCVSLDGTDFHFDRIFLLDQVSVQIKELTTQQGGGALSC